MNSKKIDGRLKLLLENNGVKKYRSVFAICGERPHLVVPILFNFLRKPKGTVLWCYKKSLDFKEKKSKNKQKKRKVDPDEDPFQMFTRSTSIRWCYYHETDRILGNSYDLLVIQDFEALTPNVLARTIETVNGGGLIVFLLKSLESIECLFMDVHKKYQTEAHKDVVSRFNKRFISALQNCQSFIAIDSFFNPLHIAAKITEVESKQEPDQTELKELKNSLKPDPLIGSLVDLCKTIDQSKAVISMIQTLSDKALRTTVSLTASRGRGKSAALGLAVAGAIGYNYCNIFVTSPSPENLKTFFEFVIKGLTALNLKRNFDYDVVNSTEPSHNKSIVMINVLNKFNQKIQYVPPKEIAENSLLKKSAELVIIDEAAAIPLPIVKTFLGPYLVFLSSTIDGYEGTGRALSLKLIEQLRKDVKNVKDVTKESKHQNSKDSPILKEITLKESIRYGDGDEVEVWLNELLCLKNIKTSKKKMDSITNLEDCKLFYINRNVLFSYHSTSEKFLKKLMALYVASHYKNSPNDLQMMADAPAHHLFCLIDSKENVHKKDSESHSQNSLPEVLCFIQVCLEGQISENSLASGLQQNKRASGDLIPWTLAQQFQDNKFPSLSGARVVRITTNPDYVGHGYGRRALKLLFDYFEGEFLNDSDSVSNEDDSETLTQESQALLVSLDERRPERLDYIGVCYGITYDLYRFWKSSGFVPVYLRQTTNELTGENSCIMIKFLQHKRAEFCNSISNDWLIEFWRDFRRRFVSLLDRVFKKFPIQLAYEILTSDENLLSIIEHQYSVDKNKNGLLSPSEIEMIFTDDDFNRCSSFLVNESVSPHGILDCLPVLSYFYFTQRCTSCVELDKKVSYIMIGLGLQRKSFKEISKELSLDYDTMLSYLRKGLKILSATLMKIKHTNDKSKS